MGKNVYKNISKNLSSKYNQNFIDHVKEYTASRATKFATDALKTAPKKQFKRSQKQLVI